MDPITFSAKDVLIVAGAVGPTLTALLGVWVRLNKWQASVAVSIEQIHANMERLEADQKDREAARADQNQELHRKLSRVHDRMDELLRATSELTGWKDALKTGR